MTETVVHSHQHFIFCATKRSFWLTWLQTWLTINRVYGGFVKDTEALSYFLKWESAAFI